MVTISKPKTLDLFLDITCELSVTLIVKPTVLNFRSHAAKTEKNQN